MLLHIPAVLSADELRQIRAVLEAAAWEDGRRTAGHRAQAVKTNQQLPLESGAARELGAIIADRLMRHPTFLSAALPLRSVPPRFNRYAGEGAYGNHVDNAIFPVPGSPLSVRTDLSITVFLCEPESYDGGELIIEDTFGQQAVKLPAGDAVLYPGSSLHRVTPVTRGARLASFFWVQSLVPQDHRRRMLYDLDQSIQRLTGDHPDHASVDQLTNIYHNLLREWSIT
ncbi:MAG: Fe2+-dependent dioxygenase [Sphingomonadales bacterium]|nr:Fe2+-dependent dioxygenase [Sphingomonadales bacterium]MDE2168238.1 Fe2+-dependent dioxygenase [Sphingomonadales bacterium]